jgi:hypothetical protein
MSLSLYLRVVLVVDSFVSFDFQHDSQRVYEDGLSEEIVLTELRNTTVLTDVSTSSSIHKIHRCVKGLGAYDDFSWRKCDMLDETKKLLDEEREQNGRCILDIHDAHYTPIKKNGLYLRRLMPLWNRKNKRLTEQNISFIPSCREHTAPTCPLVYIVSSGSSHFSVSGGVPLGFAENSCRSLATHTKTQPLAILQYVKGGLEGD